MKKQQSNITDRELIVRLRHNDLRGYELLFHKYYNLFLAFTQGFVKDRAAAEDIMQEIFMRLWIYREHLDEKRSIYNLLFTMSKNRIYDHFRRIYHVEAYERPITENDDACEEESPEIDLEMMRQTIARRVADMPPQRQRIFVMSRDENLSRQEIAERLGLSVRTVDKHLELALRELRTHLKDYQFILLVFLLLH